MRGGLWRKPSPFSFQLLVTSFSMGDPKAFFRDKFGKGFFYRSLQIGCLSDLLIIMIIYYHINPNNLADCKNVQNSPSTIKINVSDMCFLLLCGERYFSEAFFSKRNIFEAVVSRKIYFCPVI